MPPKIKRMVANHLGLKLGREECLHFLESFSDGNSPRQGASEVELKELARQSLLLEVQTYMPATQVVPPSFVTAALKYTAIMLSQFPVERCVDFLAFQTDAAVSSEGAKRRVDYGRQQVGWAQAKTKLRVPLHTQVQCYIVQRVSPWPGCLGIILVLFRHHPHQGSILVPPQQRTCP